MGQWQRGVWVGVESVLDRIAFRWQLSDFIWVSFNQVLCPPHASTRLFLHNSQTRYPTAQCNVWQTMLHISVSKVQTIVIGALTGMLDMMGNGVPGKIGCSA